MTVQELIEELKQYDPGMEVYVSGNAPVISVSRETDGLLVVLLEPEE